MCQTLYLPIRGGTTQAGQVLARPLFRKIFLLFRVNQKLIPQKYYCNHLYILCYKPIWPDLQKVASVAPVSSECNILVI